MTNSERDPLLNRNGNASIHSNDSNSINSDTDELTGRPLYLALSFPLFGLLLVSLDVTLTTTISATVASDFESLSLVSWLGAAYLVAMTVTQSVSGSLSDTYGRRSSFFAGCFLFTIGNLVCGIARTESVLILGRVLAGAGGGTVNSITTFIFSDLVSLRKRPMWQGIGNVAWAVGMGLGGVTGGVINDLVGWRWAFIALAPLTVVAWIGSYFTFVRGLPRPRGDGSKEIRSLDLAGSVMLAATLICLVLGLNLTEGDGPEEGQSQVVMIVLLAAGAVFLVAFVAVEKWWAANPVIPLHLLRNRSVTASCLAGFFVASAFHSLLFYVPMFIQAQGFSTSETGVQTLGEPIGAAIGPVLVGVAIRKLGSYAALKPVSWIVFVAAPLTYYFCNLDTPVIVIFLALTAMGAGLGSVLTINLTGLLANVDDEYQAKSTAMSYVFRQSGASIGLSLAGLLFRARVSQELLKLNPFRATGTSDSIAETCDRHLFATGSRPVICVAYANALHSVFLFTLVAGCIALVFGMLIRNVSLDRDDEHTIAHPGQKKGRSLSISHV